MSDLKLTKKITHLLKEKGLIEREKERQKKIRVGLGIVGILLKGFRICFQLLRSNHRKVQSKKSHLKNNILTHFCIFFF